jgi:23S rRNA (guanosine2251-2'-O)-methyltransferase
MSRKIPNLELDRLSPEEFKKEKKTPIIVVLDNIRSLNNIGSVFRTSDAFLIEKIYLCGITAKPPHRDINKTALGATETVAWEQAEDALSLVKKLQVEGSIMLDKFKVNPEEELALVFGNEVDGVQQEVVNQCDGAIEIPQLGTKHSLNISVSAGVVIWDLFAKLKQGSEPCQNPA